MYCNNCTARTVLQRSYCPSQGMVMQETADAMQKLLDKHYQLWLAGHAGSRPHMWAAWETAPKHTCRTESHPCDSSTRMHVTTAHEPHVQLDSQGSCKGCRRTQIVVSSQVSSSLTKQGSDNIQQAKASSLAAACVQEEKAGNRKRVPQGLEPSPTHMRDRLEVCWGCASQP
jgi:hypothetical protein